MSESNRSLPFDKSIAAPSTLISPSRGIGTMALLETRGRDLDALCTGRYLKAEGCGAKLPILTRLREESACLVSLPPIL